MNLIADSGSTKTEWALIKNQTIVLSFTTEGFNPYFQTEAEIDKNIQNQVIPSIEGINLSDIKNIFFYGAGCSNEKNNLSIKNPLQKYFTKANIEIEHDLLASARACCGNEDGIAAILGTGSNSCLFINGSIQDQIPSLGLFLGDEGSGGHIGKLFMLKFFYREFSKSNSEKIIYDLNLNKDEVLEHIYKKPFPNRYLANFTKYINDNIKQPEFESIVLESFNQFFDKTIAKYPNKYKLNCVGSIGFYFKDQLIKSASKHQFEIGKIIKTPMEGLISYHQNAL